MTAPANIYPIDVLPHMVPVERWPLHPPPYRLELLSEWVTRIADAYDTSVLLFLRHVLSVAPASLDAIPDQAQRRLAIGSGIALEQVRSMTLAAMSQQALADVERECETNPEAVIVFTRRLQSDCPLVTSPEDTDTASRG